MLTAKEGPFVYSVSPTKAGACLSGDCCQVDPILLPEPFPMPLGETRTKPRPVPGPERSPRTDVRVSSWILLPSLPRRETPPNANIDTSHLPLRWPWVESVTGPAVILRQTGCTRADVGQEDCGGAPSGGGVGDEEIIVLQLQPVQLCHKQDLCMVGTSVRSHLLVISMRRKVLIPFPIRSRGCVPAHALRPVLNVSWPQRTTCLLLLCLQDRMQTQRL